MKSNGNQILIKVALVSIFVFILNSWLAFHFGDELLNKLLANGVLVFMGILSFFLQYLAKEDEDKIATLFTGWLNSLLHYRVIVTLFVFFFFLAAFISSVHIESTGQLNNADMYLSNINNSGVETDKRILMGEGGVVRHRTVFSSPFGRSYKLQVPGFQDMKFQVFPWIGKRIIVEEDMLISPTIVFRIPEEHFIQLSRANLSVTINGTILSDTLLKGKSIIVVGQLASFPDDYCEKWLLELKGTYSEDAGINIYSIFRKWCVDEPLFIKADLKAMDSVSLKLANKSGRIIDECISIVESEKFKEIKF